MGLRDILTGRHEVRGPAPDRLFAITTAYVTLSSEHQIETLGSAAIVFQALATSEFEATLRDMEEVVKATGGDSGTTVSTEDDSYGYRWMILRNPSGAPSVEDLAVGINAVSSSIETAGHGERLLCAVFSFRDASGPAAQSVGAEDELAAGSAAAQAAAEGDRPAGAGAGATVAKAGARIYFIYNYKRGFWYPFVPAAGEQQRSTERELQIKAQMASELPMEPELERWFPLWGIPI